MNRGEAGQRTGLAFLLLPTLLLAVDLGVLWMAVPQLSADLGPTSTELLWINDSYGFAMACLLVLGGNIGDRFGRRRLLMIGLAVFTAASLLAAYAWSPAVLIVARVMLGTSSAAIIPSTLALISGMFPDTRRRARAIALWVTTLSTGIALGPVLSGVLLAHFWWGSVFLVGVPVLVVALIGCPATVPELADPDATPLDLGLFRDRTFVAAPLLLFTGLAAMNGVEYLMPQYLQLVGGVASLEAGLLMVLPAVGLALGSQLTPLLARRAGPARVIAAGAVVAIAGFALIATSPGVATVTAGTTVMMLGLAPITVLGTNIAVSAAAPEKAGQASAIGQTSYELGLAFGIAATGSLVSAVYRDHVRTSAPEGVPSDVVAEVAGNLGGGAAVPALADVARAGFTSGLQVAAIVSGCLAGLLAVFALVLLKRSRTEQREAEPVG
ncbi:MFS transporter, DHA2 family, multidrug resistance protein [Saccharopolyspora antimicrobica]|uniref:DHA2 family multidrug resistance protein-like MFS transporter n=1 Tax=Saccharopolyspora antimicrobica TaxID=455193 RepID=A0A1I4QEN0_9PSEU|nr:MFS transporter [Saccharopolyspora antimicrobica]RKT84901.1 DHA2 family multidrug resistance protein-like MFS transporter [Saccharopolyspora antimicrobica]SFM38484.1 MFS transporter, DHA2 family, multidrug resistance protein [Saccharopolyspora antimicrobica]